ncbi:transglycosylase family protein [Streptomyces sp. H27-D2]|uniref:transglycosylase family protein n=1 Tax=Streptomyces sp. H27-D2 TaxID=3046304 RepID=UPI002DBA84C2|nr:transglycosylase family protein [Streptomyces sp. H27-D2]MEC4017314.1 transglycosylase family protein [Streptomyces sp. H27-D2]
MLTSKGKHRRPSKAVRVAALAGVASAAIAVPLMGASSASAADVSTWDKVAQCESGGNWSTNTGNGYYGGLQFSNSSWAAAGGTQYAARADQASKGQQITAAEKLLALQGPGAWACAGAGNLTAGGSAADVDTSGSGDAPAAQPKAAPKPQAPQQQAQPKAAPKPQPKPETQTVQPQQKSTGSGNYTVKSGDTLAKIADAHGSSWKSVYENNKSTVGGDADLIFPGQKLSV